MSVTKVLQATWTYVPDRPVRILAADDDPVLREFASLPEVLNGAE